MIVTSHGEARFEGIHLLAEALIGPPAMSDDRPDLLVRFGMAACEVNGDELCITFSADLSQVGGHHHVIQKFKSAEILALVQHLGESSREFRKAVFQLGVRYAHEAL